MSLFKNLLGAITDVATLPVAVVGDVLDAAIGDRNSESYTGKVLENAAKSTVNAAEDLFEGRIL